MIDAAALFDPGALFDPASIGSVYRRAIVHTGRQPEFLYLVSFLGAFGFIRTSAHMIRAQISWWPGNVNVGGNHIHHLVWGILLLMISGYVGAVAQPGAPLSNIAIIGFGIGTGLTLDEFALWLNLRDVYWSQEGRRSIDAVIVVAILAGAAVVGFGAWVSVADDVERVAFHVVGTVGVIGVGSAMVNAAKEKFGMAAIGLVIPIVGLIAALRLGRPGSLWGHHLYKGEKLERARTRFPDDAPPPPSPGGEAEVPAA